jgi:hypothetical protein
VKKASAQLQCMHQSRKQASCGKEHLNISIIGFHSYHSLPCYYSFVGR